MRETELGGNIRSVRERSGVTNEKGGLAMTDVVTIQ